MEILFVSNLMSQSSYEKLYNERLIKRVEPSQKFFDLIIKGMQKDKSNNITCLSVKPVYYKIYKKIFIKKEEEKISDNLSFNYVGFINFPAIKQLSLMVTTKNQIKKWVKKHKNTKKVIVVDPMLIDATHEAIKISKKNNIKVISFITDIPSLTFSADGRLKQLKQQFIKMSNNDLCKFDGHILLTEQMNELFNKQNKPYIVIESVVDESVEIVDKQQKNNTFKIMYAGKLHEIFGIKNLVDSLKYINNDKLELIIYGDGDSVDYIKQCEKEDNRIKYMGIVSVKDAEKLEKEVNLLVNPRPTNAEFTKYSFPSKTVEYMLSGTPFLSTKLPGIPAEYFNYINAIEDDSTSGIAQAIQKLLNEDYSSLQLKAKKAQQFVLENKNYNIQGDKIIKFINYVK